MPVTMRDVALQAGVSIKTVSRVVNHQPEISDVTRQRVLAVIDSLGYRPNFLARALVTQRTQIIGLVVVTLDNPYFTDIARGVQAAGREHAYQTFLATSDEDPHEEQHILESLVAYGADGLIVYAAHLGVLCGQCFQIRKQGCCLWRGWTGRRLRRLYCLFQSRGQCLEL